MGMPVTLIGEAVFARCLSAIKDERVRASKVIAGPAKEAFSGDKQQFIDDLEQALYASKIISYAQGCQSPLPLPYCRSRSQGLTRGLFLRHADA